MKKFMFGFFMLLAGFGNLAFADETADTQDQTVIVNDVDHSDATEALNEEVNSGDALQTGGCRSNADCRRWGDICRRSSPCPYIPGRGFECTCSQRRP